MSVADPRFAIENETDLGELLGGAVKAEVERRAQKLINKHAGELQEKAGELLNDKLGGKIDLGGLFGG